MKAEPIATNPLATARQLWRLNKDGLLALVDHRPCSYGQMIEGPLSALHADAAIKIEAARSQHADA